MDAYGNLTTREDFSDGVIVRFVSRMDANVVIGYSGLQVDGNGNVMDTMTVFAQHLPVDPQADNTRFVIRPTGDGVTFRLDLCDGPEGWQVWGMEYEDYTEPLKVLPQNAGTAFRVDFVQDCWFALNFADGSQVADIKECNPAQWTPIIMFPWNGGDNQIWRAEVAQPNPVD